MAFAGALACVLRKPYDVLNSLGTAGLIQIFINPYSVYGTGFLLSYGAVVSMTLILPVMRKLPVFRVKLFESLTAGVAVNLGLLPILLYLFNGFSVIGMLSNVAAGRAAQFICVSGYAVYICDKLRVPEYFIEFFSKAVLGASAVFGKAADKIANGTGFFSRFETVSPSWLFFVLYYCLLALIIALNAGKVNSANIKYVAIPVCLAGVILFVSMQNKIEFVFFDVGQGSAALVKTIDGVTGVFDTGDGGTHLSKLLLKEGVNELDFLVISHGHDDHYGGLEEILDNIEVGTIFVPSNCFDTYCEELNNRKDIDVFAVSGRITYNIGRYSTLTMYESIDDRANINNGSVISKVSGAWGSVLLPGDAENEILEEYTETGLSDGIDILCLPHHGSNSSGSEKFLFSAMPEYVIISCGVGNQYGHPHETVLESLERIGIDENNIYRTDEYGAVRIKAGSGVAGIREFVYIWQKMRLLQVFRI